MRHSFISKKNILLENRKRTLTLDVIKNKKQKKKQQTKHPCAEYRLGFTQWGSWPTETARGEINEKPWITFWEAVEWGVSREIHRTPLCFYVNIAFENTLPSLQKIRARHEVVKWLRFQLGCATVVIDSYVKMIQVNPKFCIIFEFLLKKGNFI